MIAALVFALALAAPPSAETIAEIRVHGNHITPDAEVIALAGVTIGAPFTATTIAEATTRLEKADRFKTVEVLKRFASIEDASKIALVIIVNEGAVRIDVPELETDPLRVVKRRGLRNFMFMPILDGEDGYGLTYGVRIARPDVFGKRSRVSFPLSWGGHKQAGVELDRSWSSGPIGRVVFGGVIERRENPAFEKNDDRRRVWARAERAAGPLRGGATVGYQRVAFDGETNRLRTIGADVTFDTRVSSMLPRNAVFASASVERVQFRSGDPLTRTSLEGRGYIGAFGSTVVVVRGLREDTSGPAPRYLKSLLGGWDTLRGFEAGSFVGDTLVAGSLEYRVPLTSPASIGQFGVSAFVDTGLVYDHGQNMNDAARHTGVGGGVWFVVTAFRMGLSVAHGIGARTRVNFGGGFSF